MEHRNYVLYEHQEFAVNWIKEHKRVILADDMGLGKTLSVLDSFKDSNKILIIIPKSAYVTWKQQVPHFMGQDISQLHSTTLLNENIELYNNPNNRYFYMNYEQVRILQPLLSRFDWDCIILDEVHKIRNESTELYKSVKRLIKSLPSKTGIAMLTGTPLINEPKDLFNLLHLLDPLSFRHYSVWLNTNYYDYGGKQYRLKNKERFYDHLKPYFLRRMSKDVLSLPKRRHINVPVELFPEHKKFYNSIVDMAYGEYDGKALSIQCILELYTRAKQACLTPRLAISKGETYDTMNPTLYNGAKMEKLVELIENSEGHKVVITTSYAKYAWAIKKTLIELGYCVSVIEGSVSDSDRFKIVEDFQNGVSDVLIITMKSGGESLTLTAADILIFTDRPWTKASVDQVEARIYRMGQDKPVTIYNLRVPNSIEDRVEEIIRRKGTLSKDSLPITDIRELLVKL